RAPREQHPRQARAAEPGGSHELRTPPRRKWGAGIGRRTDAGSRRWAHPPRRSETPVRGGKHHVSGHDVSGSGGGVLRTPVRVGQAGFNRPMFQLFLAEHLSTHLSDVDARLKTDGGRIADVACGYGWSSVPSLKQFIRDLSKDVPAPDGRPLNQERARLYSN